MIQLKNIFKSYGDHIAVNGLSLDIQPNQIFGFLGPNGAGKTTCIKMITGIMPPTKGEIFINGINLYHDPISCKRITGYVPDRPYVYEKLKAWEFIEFILDLYENNTEESQHLAHYYFELFQIQDAKYKIIEDFSHGMKQKLVILSSLLHKPKLLVIDEPMVGLDPRGAQTLKKLFGDLAESGTTIFLSTHTMAVAQEVCDHIAIINKGKIVASGTMEDLRKNESDSLEEIFLQITEEEMDQN
ncbi:ABC transporter ATP-binding protein [bacterium]|nr:ABC transporter ATP-binding protein [bacterium]